MKETPWKQVNIAYPAKDPAERERQAIAHLTAVLPPAEENGLITSWSFIRKGPWRIRYLLTDSTDDRESFATDSLHPLLTHGVTWTHDIYEPEIHAFGGPASMDLAHALFHADSRHLLATLGDEHTDRRERSLLLCTALMRAAGLDINEQGDVWARVAEQRSGLNETPPDPQTWASLTSDMRHLLRGHARADLIGSDWLTSFRQAGRSLRSLRENGQLTRGVRAVIALHVIFHWNRTGLPATTQATLAQAAKEAIFDDASPVPSS
ncbi:thiopeptide-type bacteriocin biosynthesis protein [Frankia sp. AgPm24]|uniref:thiopeptide-type bacteriocin biosynthesis protein n=1 Tax=Frankia sp. AgPm24 TaxID=631128 RepID=UPI00200E718C|nr:thiopeptide-type bacteriocin biosynthesis protein [Frankia sp. AgPm24]MCK9922609.1 thiopeptide-type bacteriocin biosynthesis protein [Frankia sp. AgPm24]